MGSLFYNVGRSPGLTISEIGLLAVWDMKPRTEKMANPARIEVIPLMKHITMASLK
jgi:hypothetical protein